MREIIPQQLWLGHALDCRDLRLLHATGIAAVVDLAYEEPPAQLSRDLIYCRFPLLDGSGNSPAILQAAVAITAQLIQDRVPTLVCCGAGMSRSPAIVATALARVRGTSLENELAQFIAGHPHDVALPLLAQLRGLD